MTSNNVYNNMNITQLTNKIENLKQQLTAGNWKQNNNKVRQELRRLENVRFEKYLKRKGLFDHDYIFNYLYRIPINNLPKKLSMLNNNQRNMAKLQFDILKQNELLKLWTNTKITTNQKKSMETKATERVNKQLAAFNNILRPGNSVGTVTSINNRSNKGTEKYEANSLQKGDKPNSKRTSLLERAAHRRAKIAKKYNR
jgi:hypothetical protein